MPTNNHKLFVTLLKEEKLLIFTSRYKDLDKIVKNRVRKWIKEDFSDIPIEELGMETCQVAKFKDEIDIIIFNISYDGSHTGTDPCFGHVAFSFDGSNSEVLFNNVECAS